MIILAMISGAGILLLGILIGVSIMLAIHNSQNAEADD